MANLSVHSSPMCSFLMQSSFQPHRWRRQNHNIRLIICFAIDLRPYHLKEVQFSTPLYIYFCFLYVILCKYHWCCRHLSNRKKKKKWGSTSTDYDFTMLLSTFATCIRCIGWASCKVRYRPSCVAAPTSEDDFDWFKTIQKKSWTIS